MADQGAGRLDLARLPAAVENAPPVAAAEEAIGVLELILPESPDAQTLADVALAAHGELRDDATAMCVDWHGGPARARDTDSGADQ